MAKLEWRAAGRQGMNIADFRETAFIIEFDGPGTFIAYLRDHQITCKEHIREYRDAVLWCQEQADRLTAEAKENALPLNTVLSALVDKVDGDLFDIIAGEFGSMQAVDTGELLRVREQVLTYVLQVRQDAIKECMESVKEVQEEADREHENGESSGAWRSHRALERKLRIEQGEDQVAVDFSMKY
jgi:hypothetical protein